MTDSRSVTSVDPSSVDPHCPIGEEVLGDDPGAVALRGGRSLELAAPFPWVSSDLGQLDHRLTAPQQSEGARESPGQDFPEAAIRRVAERQPKHLGWRPKALDEMDEVDVLGHHDHDSTARRVEDLAVLGVPKPQIPHSGCLDLELRAKPRDELRGQVRVEPELHAAITG
jgi:hypothetical protein